MLSVERNYYHKRIEQESEAAARASSPAAQRAHRELIEHYSAKLNLLESIATGQPYPSTAGAPASAGANNSLLKHAL